MIYDPNVDYGVHTIRVTFMQLDYIGHIAFEIDGDCKGAALLNSDFLIDLDEENIERFVENDCDFAIDDQIFSVNLKNGNGDILAIKDCEEEIDSMIVGLEIVDFVKREEKATATKC